MHVPATLLLSFVLSIPLAAQEKLTLRYRLEPGQTSWSMVVTEKAQYVNVDGQEMKSTMTTSMWLESRVTEVRSGVATVELRYARFKVKSSDPQLQLDYDSDVEGSDPGTGALKFARLVGKTAKGKVNAMGKVLGFTLPDQPAEERVGVNLEGLFQLQFAAWPEDPIAIGETWKSSMDFPTGKWGNAKTTITNKLIAVKDDVVTLQQTTRMDTSGLTIPKGLKVDVSKSVTVVEYSLASPQAIDWNRTIDFILDGEVDAPVNGIMTTFMTIKQVEAPAPRKPAGAGKPPGK